MLMTGKLNLNDMPLSVLCENTLWYRPRQNQYQYVYDFGVLNIVYFFFDVCMCVSMYICMYIGVHVKAAIMINYI